MPAARPARWLSGEVSLVWPSLPALRPGWFSLTSRVWPPFEETEGFDCPVYPESFSAVHHMTPEGWMYQLRFDDDRTSVGFLSSRRGEPLAVGGLCRSDRSLSGSGASVSDRGSRAFCSQHGWAAAAKVERSRGGWLCCPASHLCLLRPALRNGDRLEPAGSRAPVRPV